MCFLQRDTSWLSVTNQVCLVEDNMEVDTCGEYWMFIHVTSGGKQWTIRRTYTSLHIVDRQLHRCIYDRKFSLLPELEADSIDNFGLTVRPTYLIKFVVMV